jgi:hypothetical protein
MGASIHINGTGSSIIDTVLVCRTTGIMQRKWIADSPHELAQIVEQDLNHLRAGNVKPTRGDIRCVTYGHLIRLAIWFLRLNWNKDEPITSRIAKVANWIKHFGGWAKVEKCMEYVNRKPANDMPLLSVHENDAKYGAEYADVPF